jgi:hypothetical protein
MSNACLEFASQRMKVNLSALKGMLLTHVCDVRFVRKIPKPGYPMTRRMMCTNSADLLNSIDGKMALNYTPPKGNRQINEAQSNVARTWDVIMQDYRTINAAQCDLITSIPIADFWNYFNETLGTMTSDQKVAFMNT